MEHITIDDTFSNSVGHTTPQHDRAKELQVPTNHQLTLTFEIDMDSVPKFVTSGLNAMVERILFTVHTAALISEVKRKNTNIHM